MQSTAFVGGTHLSFTCGSATVKVKKCHLRSSSFVVPRIYSRFPWQPLPASLLVAPPVRTLAKATASPRILISGAPASGKGTQCEYIVTNYGVIHISTGDMLRAAVQGGTPLGIKAKTYMDAGNLVPDDLVISMLEERITQPDCTTSGWLLDGFPRTAVQARALTNAGIEPSAVVVLDVEDDVLVERVVGRRLDPDTGKIYHVSFSPPTDPDVEARLMRRSDDTEEKARIRLDKYHEHAKSIQEHYDNMVNVVNGNRGKEEVFDDISRIIDASFKEIDYDEGERDATPENGQTAATPSESRSKKEPVAEFVRRAEEAYEKGVLEDEDVNWSGQAAADTAAMAGASTHADILRRLDLALGDVVALLVFAYIGRASHGSKSFDLVVLKTAAPFIVTWFAVSPLLGGFTRAATANVSDALKSLTRSWAIAVPMGIGLRGVITDHVPPVPFTIVTLISTYILLGSWRASYVKIRGDETDSERRGGLVEGFKMVTTLLRRW